LLTPEALRLSSPLIVGIGYARILSIARGAICPIPYRSGKSNLDSDG